MNSRSSLAGALIATLGLMFYAYSNPSIASPNAPAIAKAQQSQPAATFAYAQLTIAGDQYSFDEGGREPVRSRSLTALIQFLGSNERATYVNLLNAIGSRGWEIVEVDTVANTVTFKRQL